MSLNRVPAGTRPVNVAWLMTMGLVTRKSSAVSVLSVPIVGGLESVAILPSGLPVEKKNGSADACESIKSEAIAPRVYLFVIKAAAVDRRGAWIVFTFFIIINFSLQVF